MEEAVAHVGSLTALDMVKMTGAEHAFRSAVRLGVKVTVVRRSEPEKGHNVLARSAISPVFGAFSMEYLVDMTTNVPDGTADEAVTDMRAREAARSSELIAQGHLVRLWRPPLKPGEWRTFGLFAAADDEELESVLASMPLRVWRTDEVTPLSPHPNDPVPWPAQGPPEFLTAFTRTVPEGTPRSEVDDAIAGEARRARELAAQGHLLRLWALPPGSGPDALGLWRAGDAAEMQAIMESLPLYPLMRVEITPLTEHPSDPARAGS
ncbi:muconolactone Delta-isomerase family protein [Actinomadura sp. NTSP31]|uniref:muconolactone Delta-isomerase family protein n=1 Tax=Actinomadura sp. NTSP31 TaxID=1735447 RepID=UPI0035C0AC7E